MPVISLPEFLGIQEAPQRPVFQRTRQIAPSQWDRDMQVADAVTALRQQRPMSQIQAIQNEYDTISSNADKLRREREATIQAEQAVSALAGLTPESEDYLNQRRQLQTQFPSAMLDPRVQRIIDDSDRMYQYNQSKAEVQAREQAAAQAAQEKELNDYRIQAAEQGIPWSTVQSAPREKIASLIAQQKPRTDRSLDMREKELDFLMKQEKALREAGKDMVVTGTNEKGEEIYGANPEYDSLMKEINDRGAELRSAYRGAYSPPTAAQPSSGARIPLRPQEQPQPQSFKETMRKSTQKPPSAAEILKVDDKEIIKDLDDPSADETTFMESIKDANTSLDVKKKALEKLQGLAKSPPPRSDLTVGEAIARRSQLQKMAEEAKKDVEAYPVVQEYNKAWTGIKNTMDKNLDEFAKSISSSKDQVINSLKSGERIRGIPGYESYDTNKGGVSVRELFEQFFADKTGQEKSFGSTRPGLMTKVKELEGFRESPFADRLGMNGFFGLGGSKSWNDVLDVYLDEKKESVLPDSGKNNKVENPAGIKSITPLP